MDIVFDDPVELERIHLIHRLIKFFIKWTHEPDGKEVCLVFKTRVHVLTRDIVGVRAGMKDGVSDLVRT